jgi:hypothetical protein
MREPVVYLLRGINRYGETPTTWLCKIGTTTRLDRRRCELERRHGFHLGLVAWFGGGVREEVAMHEALGRWRISGDWFRYSDDLADEFVRLAREGVCG